MSRVEADTLMRLTLVSFAGSVLGTRLYLALTGYPQIGGGDLHIAHMLWGGLLLFAGSLLLLTLANRRVYTWGAVLSGLGVGLFIDEVGKFITRDNDYFYPAAAPIIYAAFLLTVLVYLRVRGRPAGDPRSELHHALEELKGVADGDLRPDERARLEAQLRLVADRADRPDRRRLATALLDFLESDALRLAPPPSPTVLQRWRERLAAWATRWFGEHRLRIGLILGLGLLGALAVADLVAVAGVAVDSTDGQLGELAQITNRYARIEIATAEGVALVLTRVVLDAAIGLLLLVAAALLGWGSVRLGLRLAYYGLLVLLTVVNLLVFYLDQFLAATGALVQYALLQGVTWYRGRYLDEPS